MSASWFVLYAPDDESHCLVPHSDVICDLSVKVGEDVTFVYGSRKKPITGIVKAIGDEHDKLSKMMRELNKKEPKRNSSFDADRPRKAKLVCQRTFNKLPEKNLKIKSSKQLTTSKNESSLPQSSHVTPGPSREPFIPRKLLNMEDSEDEGIQSEDLDYNILNSNCYNISDKNDSDSSEKEADIGKEEMKDLMKLIKGKKLSDIKSLLELAEKQKVHDKASMRANDSHDRGMEDQAKKDMDKEKNKKKDTKKALERGNDCSRNVCSTVAEDSSDNEDQAKKDKDKSDDKEKEIASRCTSKRRKYDKKQFTGDFFRFKEESPNCIQLSVPYKVYVRSNALREIKREAKSILTIARKLTSEVFSPEAIMECTVSGRPSSARPGVLSQIRPALHPDGVNAIFEYCKSRARKRHVMEPTFTSVKKSIMDVLNETRYAAKLQNSA